MKPKSFFKILLISVLSIIVIISGCRLFPMDSSSKSSSNTDNTVSAPDTPQNFNATDGEYEDKVELSWDEVPEADYYNVYRADSSSGSYEMIGYVEGGVTATYNSTTSPSGYEIVTGTHYFYKVEAEIYNASDETFIQSELSSADEGWAASGVTVPSDFSISYTYSRSASTNPPSVSGYTISIGPGTSGEVKNLATSETRELSITQNELTELYQVTVDHDLYRSSWTPYDPGRTPTGVTYNYSFAATLNGETYSNIDYRSGDEDEQEDLDAILEAVKDLGFLPAPSGVTATWDSLDDHIDLSWDSVPEAVSYVVYAAQQSSGDYSMMAEDISGTSYSLNTFDPATTLYLKIAAVDELGFNGSLSEYKSVSPVMTLDFEPDTSSTWYHFFTNESDYPYTTAWTVNIFGELVDSESFEFEMKKESGSLLGGYGVVFNYSDVNNFHFMLINNNGSYYVGERDNGSFVTIKDWTDYSSINTGYGSENTIKIIYTYAGRNYKYNAAINDSSQFTLISSSLAFTGNNYGCIWEVLSYENFPDDPVDVYFRQTSPEYLP